MRGKKREMKRERENHGTVTACFSEVEIVMCTAHTHKINLHPTIALQCSLKFT